MKEVIPDNDQQAVRACYKRPLTGRYTEKLIDSAELLYSLSSRDGTWKPKHH